MDSLKDYSNFFSSLDLKAFCIVVTIVWTKQASPWLIFEICNFHSNQNVQYICVLCPFLWGTVSENNALNDLNIYSERLFTVALGAWWLLDGSCAPISTLMWIQYSEKGGRRQYAAERLIIYFISPNWSKRWVYLGTSYAVPKSLKGTWIPAISRQNSSKLIGKSTQSFQFEQ